MVTRRRFLAAAGGLAVAGGFPGGWTQVLAAAGPAGPRAGAKIGDVKITEVRGGTNGDRRAIYVEIATDPGITCEYRAHGNPGKY